MNLEEIAVDYVVVDTLRIPRETFDAILEAGRDGYSESIGQLSPITRESAVAYFNSDDRQRAKRNRLRRLDGPDGERANALRLVFSGTDNPVCALRGTDRAHT